MTLGLIGATSLVRQLSGWRGDANAGDPAYRQLARALRLLIRDGRLPAGKRLPGERDLARALGVSRTMVTAAYTMLRDEGCLASRQGSGSVVALPGLPPANQATATDLAPYAVRADMLDMTCATLPASSAVYGAYETALADLPQWLRTDGYDPAGILPLRQAIAARYEKRGCPTGPDQILVTSGAQSGLVMLLRMLTAPGDRVLIDHPSYSNAIAAIQRAACRAVPVGVSHDGWDIDALVTAFRQAGPRLAYMIADFHNPTGQNMDIPTRRALVATAARAQAALVIDETMADTWIDAPPAPPVAAFDGDGTTVITLGSMGKQFWGGVRIGWIRADAATIAALSAARSSFDMASPVMEQLVAARLLDSESEEIAAGRRAMLRARRDHLVALLETRLPDWRTSVPGGGLCLWVDIPAPLATALAAIAQTYGLQVAPGPRFGLDGAFERCLRLPFTLPEDRLDEAVAILARSWAQLRPGDRAARGMDPGQPGARII